MRQINHSLKKSPATLEKRNEGNKRRRSPRINDNGSDSESQSAMDDTDEESETDPAELQNFLDSLDYRELSLLKKMTRKYFTLQTLCSSGSHTIVL